MSDFQFSFRKDHAVSLTSARKSSTGQSVHVAISTSLMASTAFGAVVSRLSDALFTTIPKLSNMAQRYSAAGYREAVTPIIFGQLTQSFRQLRDAAVQRERDRAVQFNDWATPKFTQPNVPDTRVPFRSELRSRLAAMKPAQAIELALRDYDVAAAVAEGGRAIANWPSDLWQRFIETFAERNLAKRLEAQYTHIPSADDPLREGTDIAAAADAARSHIAANRESIAEIDSLRTVLQSVIDLVALAMDTNDRDAAFKTLMGKA